MQRQNAWTAPPEMLLPQGILGRHCPLSFRNDSPLYPVLKQIREEALKDLSLAFRESDQLSSWLPLQYLGVIWLNVSSLTFCRFVWLNVFSYKVKLNWELSSCVSWLTLLAFACWMYPVTFLNLHYIQSVNDSSNEQMYPMNNRNFHLIWSARTFSLYCIFLKNKQKKKSIL